MSEKPTPPANPPPYAFAQGTGTVFQFVGVGLFLISMFICCCTSLLGKDTATHSGLTEIGWHRAGDAIDQPTYSAQRALSVSLPMSLCYGMALAALGLGLQSENRAAVTAAVALNGAAVIFWIVQLIFFASIRWIVMSIVCIGLVMLAILMSVLSVGAWRDMRSSKEIRHEV